MCESHRHLGCGAMELELEESPAPTALHSSPRSIVNDVRAILQTTTRALLPARPAQPLNAPKRVLEGRTEAKPVIESTTRKLVEEVTRPISHVTTPVAPSAQLSRAVDLPMHLSAVRSALVNYQDIVAKNPGKENKGVRRSAKDDLADVLRRDLRVHARPDADNFNRVVCEQLGLQLSQYMSPEEIDALIPLALRQ